MLRGRGRAPVHSLWLCLPLACVTPLQAQNKDVWNKLWSFSVAALVAANTADAVSTAGRSESNPLLRNAHGGLSAQRAVLIKASGTGGMVLLQCLLRRRMPQHRLEKPAAIINFAAAATAGAVAYRNSTIPRSPAGPP